MKLLTFDSTKKFSSYKSDEPASTLWITAALPGDNYLAIAIGAHEIREACKEIRTIAEDVQIAAETYMKHPDGKLGAGHVTAIDHEEKIITIQLERAQYLRRFFIGHPVEVTVVGAIERANDD